MKLYNVEIESFVKFLMDLELPAKKSRMRTRFCKLCFDRIQLIQEEKLEIIKRHANLDDNGEIKKTEDEKGRLIYDIKDKIAYSIDYKELMTEEWIIDETDEKKDMLLTLQDAVLNLDITLKGTKAIEYDRWCEILEKIKY